MEDKPEGQMDNKEQEDAASRQAEAEKPDEGTEKSGSLQYLILS